ncbi:MAG: hypothetical protein LUH04_08120 [Clostridium sp.]|nr:hypothetical protein [Clostridium sp.]
MEIEELNEIYNLEPDLVNNTSLIEWYNSLIEKTYEELSIYDVEKMFRQNILPDLAAKAAIRLFIANPLDGEFGQGAIVETILNHSLDVATHSELVEMRNTADEYAIKSL